MKVPMLILHDKVSEKWLETCHEKLEMQLYKTINIREMSFIGNEIVSQEFMLESYNNIKPRHAPLVEVILNLFNVRGVWRKELIPGSVETITTVKVFGYEPCVKLAINMLHFLFNGFDRYYLRHVGELRNKRRLRRNKGMKLPYEVDARKRTHSNIQNKVSKLLILLMYSYIPRVDDQMRTTIFNYIVSHEKLNIKKYRGMKTISVNAYKCRPGVIQLNRII